MDILAYLNKHYPHFNFSISVLITSSIKICTKETCDLDGSYFKNVPKKIYYIHCPENYLFFQVINKTVPPDMMNYYISETERILKYEIRKLKIKKLYNES
jgi:hypothetical protein